VSSRAWAVVGVVVGAVLLWNLVALALDKATGNPGGPVSSSYATAAEGLAAYFDLLRRSGHPVSRLRDRPAQARLDPASTVVLLDPVSVSRADAAALRRFVEAGGRLVAGGAGADLWVGAILDHPPSSSPGGPPSVEPIAPVEELAGVSAVRAEGSSSWADAGEALPVLGGSSGTALLVVASQGRGRTDLLADASPLQNRLLGTADNAALGVGLAGPASRPVRFVESVHGYGESSGLRAIPSRWRWALAGLALAALLLMVARGRRLGPPESEARALPPPRRAYVESLAATLARTKRPAEAAAPVRAAARKRLARRAGLDPGAPPERLAEAAARLHLTPEETAAILGSTTAEADIMAAGRALARLETGNGGGRE
jgi:hypothetical protein